MESFLAKYMPIDISAHGAELDRMNALVHWLMAILFVGWGLYFVYVLFRFRAGRNPEAIYEGTKSHFNTYVEAGIVVLEVVLLVGFSIPAWARWVTPPPIEQDPFVLRVQSMQFAWNIHYPGPDGLFGRTDPSLVNDQLNQNPLGIDREDPNAADDIFLQNQLHLPANRPITVLLSSRDVIHSFSLPVARVKQDAIPGSQIPVHCTLTQTNPPDALYPACFQTKTCWEIACAQLCGMNHFRMQGYLTVHEQADFDAWMAAEVAKVTPAVDPPAADADAVAVTPEDREAESQ